MKKIISLLCFLFHCGLILAQKAIPDYVTFVDLGLPSHTVWANMNVGAEKPEECGDYFAWLDTRPKNDYSRSTLQDYSVERDKFIIYTVNGLMQSFSPGGPEDAAGWNWGEDCHTPTPEDCRELLKCCKFISAKVNGKSGFKVIGPNGNSIFLPAAGNRIGKEEPDGVGTIAMYWTNRICNSSEYAGTLLINAAGYQDLDCYPRHWGCPVRAVKDKWSIPNTEYFEKGWISKEIAASSLTKMKQQKQHTFNGGTGAISLWTEDKVLLFRINSGILDTDEDPEDKVTITVSYYDESGSLVVSSSPVLTMSRYYSDLASASKIDAESIINYLINRKGHIEVRMPVYTSSPVELSIPCLNNE